MSAPAPAIERTGTATAVAGLVAFLETGAVADGLFAPAVFSDLTLPHWRIQGDTAHELVAIRRGSHPYGGRVHVARVDETPLGFVIEFEERWEHEGQQWYSREMIRADVVDASIVDVSIYCTGDWDEAKQTEHAASVRLLRP